jgi:hypothetical protein
MKMPVLVKIERNLIMFITSACWQLVFVIVFIIALVGVREPCTVVYGIEQIASR